MTKEELSKLTKIRAEIELLKKQLEATEPEFVTDGVTGSSPHFPYVKHSIKVEGYDLNGYNAKVKRIRGRINRKLVELVTEKDNLTEYIYSIEDSDLRQILIYRYIDGLHWEKIGVKMHYGTSTIRCKHDTFLKSMQ